MANPEQQSQMQSKTGAASSNGRELPQIFSEQLAWYDKHARYQHIGFLILKATQIFLSAAIPVIALIKPSAPAVLNGVIGAVILTIEGFQQLFQCQQNWTRYRATCEGLRREGFLFVAGAGPYTGASEPTTLLVERMDSLINAENKTWSTLQEQTAKGAKTS
jgi:hypothetical protein